MPHLSPYPFSIPTQSKNRASLSRQELDFDSPSATSSCSEDGDGEASFSSSPYPRGGAGGGTLVKRFDLRGDKFGARRRGSKGYEGEEDVDVDVEGEEEQEEEEEEEQDYLNRSPYTNNSTPFVTPGLSSTTGNTGSSRPGSECELDREVEGEDEEDDEEQRGVNQVGEEEMNSITKGDVGIKKIGMGSDEEEGDGELVGTTLALPRRRFSNTTAGMNNSNMGGTGGGYGVDNLAVFPRSGTFGLTSMIGGKGGIKGLTGSNSAGAVLMNEGEGGRGGLSGTSTTVASAVTSPGPAAAGSSGGGGGGGVRGIGLGMSEYSGATGVGRMAAAAQRARERTGKRSEGSSSSSSLNNPNIPNPNNHNNKTNSTAAVAPFPFPSAPPNPPSHPLSEHLLSQRGYSSHLLFHHHFHLESRWSNLRELGQGAYGLVISAQDKLSGEVIAVKMLTRVFDKLILARRCLREVTLLRHLNGHENITGLIDLDIVVDDFNEIYMFMEPMEADLHQIIRSGQQLTNSHITYFLYQLLRGMKYVHSANVIHRDLKPGNLLVNADCELKICDFGLARGFRPDPTEWDPNSMGPGGALTEYVATRWYRAPEIMLSYRRYSTAIDVWSIGCILAELLGGKPIFKGKDYIDQLNLILQTLGTPSDETLAAVGSDRANAYIRSLPRSEPVSFTSLYPDAEPLAIDLLQKLLVFDPSDRMTVKEALKHPYLAAYHDETDEPDCPMIFDKWEEVENIHSIEEFRVAIAREVEEFRKEVRAVDEWEVDEEGEGEAADGQEGAHMGHGEEGGPGSGVGSPEKVGVDGLPGAGIGANGPSEVLMDRSANSSTAVSNTSTVLRKTGSGHAPGTPKSAVSDESFSNSMPASSTVPVRTRRGSGASGALGDPFRRRSGSSFGLSSMVGMTPLNSDAATGITGIGASTTVGGEGYPSGSATMSRHVSRSSFSSEYGLGQHKDSRMKCRQPSTSSIIRPLVRGLSQISVADLHVTMGGGGKNHDVETDGPPPMSVSPADAPPSEAPLTFGTKGKLMRLPSVENKEGKEA